MRPLEKSVHPRESEIPPRAARTIPLAAALALGVLWAAGADRVAIGILLGFTVFLTILARSYYSDIESAQISAERGAIVGGLSFPLWAAWVVWKSSYETRGLPYPYAPGEWIISLVAAVFCMFVGAGLGAPIGVIGGRFIRLLGGWSRLVCGLWRAQKI